MSRSVVNLQSKVKENAVLSAHARPIAYSEKPLTIIKKDRLHKANGNDTRFNLNG